MSNREIAIDLIQKLPQDASLHDIAREIEFIAGVREGFEQMARGEGVAAEEVRKTTDASSSIGLELEEDGTITDVVPGLPAEKAGLAPGMKLVAVGGRRWSRKVLFEALAATPRQTGPLELLVENAEYFKTYQLDYHGGERYPHLERDPAVPDLLSSIHSPITAKPSGAGTGP